MADKKQTQPTAHPDVLLDGKPATKQEYMRIYGAPATPSDKDDRATKPIETVSRGFKLMR